MGIYEKIMMEDDDGILCSACNQKIFWGTKSCCIYSCYNHVCSKCRYCEEHYSLNQLQSQLVSYIEWWEKDNKSMVDTITYSGFLMNDKISIENGIQYMELNNAKGFKLMQQVHGKRLPDSRLITSFLY